MRDILLVKCKQAIEELHLELEDEKKIRATAEESVARLERDIVDKDSAIRDLTHRNEKLIGTWFKVELWANIFEKKRKIQS